MDIEIDKVLSYQIIMGSAVFFLLVDILSGAMSKKGVFAKHEMLANVLSFINFLVIRVGLVAFYGWLLVTAFPGAKGSLSEYGFWTVFAAYVLIEEYIHYWIHRLSHTIPWLWRLHKPHHAPQHVNLSVSFRENWLWFVIIPNPLLGGLLIFAGHPEAAFAAVAWKGASEFMVHSATRWDLVLHKFWLTKPLMRAIEKFITLPDTHHAHHGVGQHGHGMCNFGSFLFLYDVLHGTAEFPHAKQEGYGMPESVKVEKWPEQLYWPLIQDKEVADLQPPTKAESQVNVIRSDDGNVSISL